MILGTACYMSPEQAKGKDTDQRADIWAFAVMFVEMLTGKRLFDGETVTDVIAAVVTRPLPLDRLPTPLRPALSRCLERDPRRRLRHIGDFFALVEASSAPVPPPSTRAPRGLALALTVFASIAAITILAATWSFLRAIPDAPVAQFTFNPPAGQNLTLSSASTSLLRTAPAPVAVSPDGRHIAFLANLPSGRSQIWVRSLDALSAQPLPGTDGATSPFWSLDNNFIAFFADGRLRKIRATGGPPVSLTEVPDYRGGSWGDGVIVFARGDVAGPLFKVSDAGGIATPATIHAVGEGQHIRPTFLPDGRRFFYRVSDGGLYLASLDSSARTLITQAPSSGNAVYAWLLAA